MRQKAPGRMVALLGFAFAAALSPAAAITFTVNNNGGDLGDSNPGDGVCQVIPGACTLRAALEEANASIDPDVTVVIPALTFELSLGEIQIGRAMTIQGAGIGATRIVRQAGSPSARFLHHTGGVLVVNGIEVRDFHPATGSGGAIDSQDQLTLSDCKFENNQAPDRGGAIRLAPGAINLSTIERSLLWNNAAPLGGAIAVDSGSVSIRESFFTGNTAATAGGAIRAAASSTVILVASTLFANAAGAGGALWATSATVATINSTINENDATTDGGGIYLDGASSYFLGVYNSTVVHNRARVTGAVGTGGGLFAGPSTGGAVDLANSILIQNQKGGLPQECTGAVTSNGYNVVEFNDASCTITGLFVSGAPANFGTFGYHGGFTPTYSVSAPSPIVDGGDPSGCEVDPQTPIPTDQRGAIRPYSFHCDLGSFELGPLVFSDDFDLGTTERWSAAVP